MANENGADASAAALLDKPPETPVTPEVTGSESARISLKPLGKTRALVPIRGLSPVIPHAWSDKALRLMREAQSGSRTRAKHDAKDPEAEAEGATYYLPDGVTPGLPATAFKAAIVGATRLFQGITMVQAKTVFFVEGVGAEQLIALDGERFIREDTPRNANGSPDLRYRYTYWPWSAVLPITFLPSQIDFDSVLTLVNAGGLGGVGDWRPSAPKSLTGTFGMFEINPDREIEIDEGR